MVKRREPRIDRLLISNEWSDVLKDVKHSAMARVISNHTPIILEYVYWEAPSSYFKFENMWLQSEGFLEMVKEWRLSYIVKGTPNYILVQKLRLLKIDITV